MQEPVHALDPHAAFAPTADDAVAFPDIPGYRFQKKLGQGGMATVYLATQESLDRPVGIKVMERTALHDETSMQRFENEARTIAKLAHPGIVGIHDVGRTADGRMYYCMPFLPNGDLAQRDLTGDELRIVDVLRRLLSALAYAHARDVVHRDVKPENVLFDTDNRPLLTDFGIALSTSDTVRITTAGLTVGSSGYMAPEQARGEPVDARADLYSVGVVAYELLTGELPFKSGDALAMALMHAQDPIPRLPAARNRWQGFIDRAMAKSREQRFDNATQMLDALDRIGQRSGDHFPQRALRTFDRAAPGEGWKRPRLLVLAAALVVGGGLYAAHPWKPSEPAKPASAASAPARTAVAPKPSTPAVPPVAAPPIQAAPPPADTASTAKPAQSTTTAKPAHRTHARRKPVRRHGPIRRLWDRITH